MRKNFKLLGAVAVAGIVATTGSAFTGAGATVNNATQFIGGTVSQTVTGANVASVTYTEGTTAPGTGTYQTSVALAFSEDHPAGSIKVKVDGGAEIVCAGSAKSFTCDLDGSTVSTGVVVGSLAITATA